MKINLRTGAVVLFALLGLERAAAAASTDVTGLWYAIDETTQKPNALVKMTLNGDMLSGVVQKVMAEGAAAHPLCDRCEGDRRGKPVEGMTIVWDLKRHKDTFKGGHILDPKKGATYRCEAKLRDDGRLEVRGYLGIALFGRTQLWQRANPADPKTPQAMGLGVKPRT